MDQGPEERKSKVAKGVRKGDTWQLKHEMMSEIQVNEILYFYFRIFQYRIHGFNFKTGHYRSR